MRYVAIALLSFSTLLAAADLSGTWQYEQTGRNGQKRVTTLVFKTEGSKFTGTYATPSVVQEIVNGAVNGNQITFEVKDETQESRLVPYKGDLDGEQLTVSRIPPPPRDAPSPQANRATPPPMALKRISSETAFHVPPELTRTHQAFPPFQAIRPNGFARTPPMGWNSWNKFAGRVDDRSVREMADAMVSSGMRDAGYIYVNIDDTWEGTRDKDGNIQSNEKFPNMKALADYVHSKGLRIGIYSSPGRKTCAGFEGSYGHEEQDARTWAAWGFDYLKYDWCSATAVYRGSEMPSAYQKMALALRATGRPIIYSLCQYGQMKVGEWGAASGGNLWRTTGDISDSWQSMSRLGFDSQVDREKFAGPGHWNDPDMLEIGNGHMTDTEYRTHMSLWSLLAAPLLAGNDIRSMTDSIKQILVNREVIAIDQDPLGQQGVRLRKDGDLEVWKRQLKHGVAIGLFNRGSETAKIAVKWSEAGVKSKKPKVRDLWTHSDVHAAAEYSAEVPSHGVVLLRVE